MDDNFENDVRSFIDQPLPEAGGVSFVKMYGYTPAGGMYEINVTARGETPIIALESLMEAMGYATKTYGLMPHPFKNENHVPVVEEQVQKQVEQQVEQPKNVPAEPVKRKEIPAGGGEFFAKTIKFLPLPNGRINVEFWNNDTDEYAVFKWNCPIEMAKGGLNNILNLTLDDYEKAGIYRANVRGVWKPSEQLNKYNNKPFRNLIAIEVQ